MQPFQAGSTGTVSWMSTLPRLTTPASTGNKPQVRASQTRVMRQRLVPDTPELLSDSPLGPFGVGCLGWVGRNGSRTPVHFFSLVHFHATYRSLPPFCSRAPPHDTAAVALKCNATFLPIVPGHHSLSDLSLIDLVYILSFNIQRSPLLLHFKSPADASHLMANTSSACLADLSHAPTPRSRHP